MHAGPPGNNAGARGIDSPGPGWIGQANRAAPAQCPPAGCCCVGAASGAPPLRGSNSCR
jgi:hypothetical protein